MNKAMIKLKIHSKMKESTKSQIKTSKINKQIKIMK